MPRFFLVRKIPCLLVLCEPVQFHSYIQFCIELVRLRSASMMRNCVQSDQITLEEIRKYSSAPPGISFTKIKVTFTTKSVGVCDANHVNLTSA